MSLSVRALERVYITEGGTSFETFFTEIYHGLVRSARYTSVFKSVSEQQDLEIMKLSCQFVNCLTYPRKIPHKLRLIVVASC